mmetsp:Transcript_13950/g.18239  ORF Transcript_13950/g.18239 Transcript_13950/m.18239 type:complete len:530 (+) Transcript_13950:150-1739(+)
MRQLRLGEILKPVKILKEEERKQTLPDKKNIKSSACVENENTTNYRTSESETVSVKCESNSPEGEDHSESLYEMQRLENIRRNEEFLKRIGLSSVSAPKTQQKRTKKNHVKSLKRRRAGSFSKRVLPPRRSRRHLPHETTEEAPHHGSKRSQDGKAESQPSRSYVESSLRPIVNKNFSFSSSQEIPSELYDRTLKKAYSMHFHPLKSLLIAGGHGGKISIFDLGRRRDITEIKDEGMEPSMTFKGSRGWISGVQFLSAGASGAMQAQSDQLLFLSTSNDGQLALWDASKQEETDGSARLVCSTSDVHSSGIFGMHAIGTEIATASKDSSVCVSIIKPDGFIETMEEYRDMHNGVVKSVHLNSCMNGKVFASAGNDSIIKIKDRRTGAASGCLTIENVHGEFCINSVKWNPVSEHVLMSTSFGRNIVLSDIRKSSTPMFVLDNHIDKMHPKTKSIYHPCFYDSGDYLITTGERSTFLTTYEVRTGSVVGREDIGYQCNSISVQNTNTKKTILAASHGKSISLLQLNRTTM